MPGTSNRSSVSGLNHLLAVGLLLGLQACTFRTSFEEATKELADLVAPAAEAAFAKSGAQPTITQEPDPCSDALLGPSDGLRPTLNYEISLSELSDPQAFVLSAEAAWKTQGLDVSVDDYEGAISRRVGRNGYRAQLLVHFENQEVSIAGSGPCADNPETNSLF